MIVFVVEVETWPGGDPATKTIGYYQNLDAAVMYAVETAMVYGGYWKLTRYDNSIGVNGALNFSATRPDEDAQPLSILVTCYEVRS
jgi:hypothetical protein